MHQNDASTPRQVDHRPEDRGGARSQLNKTDYSTLEVARRLGVSLQTVQRWVDAGHLDAWRTPGGHRRIEAASAERMFREHGLRTEAAASSLANVRATPSARAVVIVDDDPIDRELLRHMVKATLPDVHVELAANGFQGLLAIGRVAPAAVITDVNMPHMNGLEMIRQLHADGLARPRTLIAVSAHTESELAAIGTLPTDVSFLAKPVDAARLAEALLHLR